MTSEGETYDFIVTGAGSAGCVVAARLSESGRHRVLLLEAGPPDTNPWIHIPLGFAKTYVNPQVNWKFETEPQPQLANRRLYLPRGKTLGGSSSINGMVYMRGSHGDYDEWRQRGCEGWDWDSVLPFFKKAENQAHGANEFHGVGGPLHVSDQPGRFELADAVLAAAEQAGIPRNPDFNGAWQEGCGYYQTTSSNRRRWSTAKAYLEPARRRPNLTIRTGAHATRVLIENHRAVGVEYHTRDGRRTARAGGEIIVSGGAYGSPQLLLLSGLGPAQHLQDMGIDVVQDMPAVGANLHDHFNSYVSWRCTRPITLNDLENRPWRKVSAGVRYFLFRSGPMASNGIHAGLFTRSDPRFERPDIQINIFEWSTVRRDKERVVPHPFPGFTLSPVHLRPDGRGTVRLASADPLAPPAILFDYLRTDYDMQAGTVWHPPVPLDRRAAGAATLCGGGTRARPGGGVGFGLAGLRPPERRFQPAPYQFLRHGPRPQHGGRSAAARARHRWAARGGCLDHAGCGRRQHQRTDHHDRREMRGDDSGG